MTSTAHDSTVQVVGDPVLERLSQATRPITTAQAEIRLLIAYAREFTGCRPYRLADLAAVCGYSISGVRTAYRDADQARIAEHLLATDRVHLAPEEFLNLLDQILDSL